MDEYIIKYKIIGTGDGYSKRELTDSITLNYNIVSINTIAIIIKLIFNDVDHIDVYHNNRLIFTKDKIVCKEIFYDEIVDVLTKDRRKIYPASDMIKGVAKYVINNKEQN